MPHCHIKGTWMVRSCELGAFETVASLLLLIRNLCIGWKCYSKLVKTIYWYVWWNDFHVSINSILIVYNLLWEDDFIAGKIPIINLNKLSYACSKETPAPQTHISFVAHFTYRILGKRCIETHFTINSYESIFHVVIISDKMYSITLLENNTNWWTADSIAKNKYREYGIRSMVIFTKWMFSVVMMEQERKQHKIKFGITSRNF